MTESPTDPSRPQPEVEKKLDAKRKDQLRCDAAQLEGMLAHAIDAGLPAGSSEAAEEIRTCIRRSAVALAASRESADRDDEAAATLGLVEAATLLNQAIAARGLGWRLMRSGVFEALSLLAFGSAVILLALGWRPLSLGGWATDGQHQVWGVPVAALGWGALGSTLRSLYWVCRKVGQGRYLPRFAISYVCAPILGALFGAFIYLLSEAGLFILDGDTSVGNEAVPLALAFIAGFNWESVLDWVKRFGSRTSAKDSRP